MYIYKTIIRSILIYAAESTVLSQREEEQLRIVERKIIRAILGVRIIKENRYQIAMNFESKEEEGVKLLMHLWRAEEQLMTYSILK